MIHLSVSQYGILILVMFISAIKLYFRMAFWTHHIYFTGPYIQFYSSYSSVFYIVEALIYKIYFFAGAKPKVPLVGFDLEYKNAMKRCKKIMINCTWSICNWNVIYPEALNWQQVSEAIPGWFWKQNCFCSLPYFHLQNLVIHFLSMIYGSFLIIF